MPRKKKKEEENLALYWVIGGVIGIVIVLFSINPLITKLNTVEYEGLSFTKTTNSGIPVYYYYRFYESKTGGIIKNNLYLRNDPRENDIPVEGEIELSLGKITYISVNGTGLDQCQTSSLAIGVLTDFLVGNEFNVKGASPDRQVANESKVRYRNCDENDFHQIIQIEQAPEGEETKIYKVEDSKCYRVQVAQCEVLEASEKFIVQTLVDAKKRAEKEFRVN